MVRQKYQILLVEDDPVARGHIERIIRDRGLAYNLDIVSSSQEASAQIETALYDVALLNYRLPDGTAFDLFARIKGTPVILLTSVGSEEIADLALKRGAYDYIIKDPEDNYLSLIPGTIRNVITRKQMENAQRESEERYQDLFDNAPDMYFRISHDGSILSVNQQIVQFGYDLSELIGQSIYDLIRPEDVQIVKRQISNALTNPNEVYYTEFKMLKANGSYLHVSESHSVQPQQGNRPPVIRLICRDITDRIQAEMRERELQERLSRSERMESLGVLAGGVAHDLNNILGPMVAYPDLLMNSFDEGSRDYQDLLEIRNSAARAVEVVRDLLTLARRGQTARTILQVNDVIDEFLGSAAFADLQERYPKVHVKKLLSDDLSTISGATSQIMKAVMNLIINAYEAMYRGGTLKIETSNVELHNQLICYESIPRGEYVKVNISDTGTGIEPGIIDKIFEPFYSDKKLGRSGSGLGLAVVYGVAKDHDGYIDVHSTLGKGTRFSIYLPVATEPVGKEQEDVLGDIRGEERILVVDDMREQLTTTKRLLTSLGYVVELAQDGHKALDLIHERKMKNGGQNGSPFDLVILDMLLEEDFDGLDAYRSILKEVPAQKCIITSGVSPSERVERMQEIGAGSYVQKPFTLDTIGRAVRHELDKKPE